ncbi:MAG TPA: SufD family Fe-S cluster assembly protein, partial [Candidatus Dojkabacteria bacterium]|nr:SufD family Fe-S cluster assembly protein [Candidatus Dojkabacteria bacterium]
KNSKIDVGSKIVLSGNNSSGEAISRAIANESSIINARGSLISVNNNTRAHLDCRGILLSEKAIIYAVPELLADGTPKADLSHEAAIGPISDEEVEYLMSRGVSRDDAISLITSGFMDVKILGLPDQLENYINELVKLTAKESL